MPDSTAADLELLVTLVNTRGITRADPYAREELGSPEALDRWWAARPAAGPTAATAADLALTLDVREGLRALLALHNDATVDDDHEAITRLERASTALPLHVQADQQGRIGLGPVDARGARHELARVLAAAVRAQSDGSWERLKVCRDPDCREAYHDTTKNRSRTWCSMAVCGSRSKQRAFARRRAGAAE
jgi:predicted RNA-binding Zn ribbon-like protein